MPINPNKIDYSKGLPECLFSFEIIQDPRIAGNKKHHFGVVLFMVVSAMLCGMNTFAAIETFCRYQTNWLSKWIKMPHGVPRAQTFSNIFQLIDNRLFNQCIINHLQTLIPDIQQQIILLK
jgi:hypothetical protein